MPDAREMLKALAKTNRHKGVEIKVPPSSAKPIAPKKIKRDGPTRPYHQQLNEGSSSEAESNPKEQETRPETTESEQSDDVLVEEIQVLSSPKPRDRGVAADKSAKDDRLTDKAQNKLNQLKHSSTDFRKAKTEKADFQLSENREACSDVATIEPIKVEPLEPQASPAQLQSAGEARSLSETLEEKQSVSEVVLLEPQSRGDRNADLQPIETHSSTTSEGYLQVVSEDSAPEEFVFNHLLQPSTDIQLSENRLSDTPQPNEPTKRIGATVASDVVGLSQQISSVSPRRSGGKTVTNLAKRSLIRPDWEADFSRDESYLREYFRGFFGKGKYMKEVDLYCQLYSLGKAQQSITLHFLSAQIGELVGSSSNGTIRTRLITCEEIGLIVQQGFNNETMEHRRGTYIHLRFPWSQSLL